MGQLPKTNTEKEDFIFYVGIHILNYRKDNRIWWQCNCGKLQIRNIFFIKLKKHFKKWTNCNKVLKYENKRGQKVIKKLKNWKTTLPTGPYGTVLSTIVFYCVTPHSLSRISRNYSSQGDVIMAFQSQCAKFFLLRIKVKQRFFLVLEYTPCKNSSLHYIPRKSEDIFADIFQHNKMLSYL